MTKRKIILLSINILLILIIIGQNIFSSKGKIKEITTKENPTKIIIENHSEKITILKNNNTWELENNLPLQNDLCNYIAKTSTSLKIIDTVSKTNSEEETKKYGFDNPIIVTALSDNKIIQQLIIGKPASNNNQSYVKLNNKKEIFLVSGNLNSLFEITSKELLDMTLYSLDINKIYKIEISKFEKSNKTQNEPLEKNITIEKSGEISNYDWKIISSTEKFNYENFNSQKFQNWLNNILELSTEKWIDDFNSIEPIINGTPEIKIVIGSGGKDIIINLYKNNDNIICLCSENEHPCLISEIDWNKFNINFNEFIK